ncbi:chorismate synthase [Tasmannia lanceolata]|uniref:chorismate synthase n=1 Tax=Tasmannia lanceolata TaxID=3420 RepID=UPI004062DF26
MSAGNEDQCSSISSVESKQESQKQSRISYARDFLLSLGELDICKRLPTGFDPSILSEFADPFYSVPDRQRIPGGLSLQSSKRGDYGSSLPSRLDNSSNYSQGSHGKWDTRSSGSNDRDGDSHSDRESVTQDSERRYGNQSRRPWQNPEHDGLLGSGAFPRPSGYAGGASTAKVRGNGEYQLNRSTEPYHPPRPYKALPHSRRDTTDSINDETFCSDECSSEGRAEEERKRRISFELIRKEQQKALQEKQKHIPNHRKDVFGTDIASLLENSEDDQSLWDKSNNKSQDRVATVSQNDSVKCSLPTQAPASRPLIPPGFMSTLLEKNLCAKSSVPSLSSEVGNIGFGDNITTDKCILVENVLEGEKKSSSSVHSSEPYETERAGVPLIDTNENTVIPLPAQVSNCSFGFENPSDRTSSKQEASEGPDDGAFTDFDAEKVPRETTGGVGHDNSASILEKLFGNALTEKHVGSPNFSEHQGVKLDEHSWSSIPSQSSKFAHWFQDEERKAVDDLSSSKARDLLSLIVNNDKVGSLGSAVSEDKGFEHISTTLPFDNNGDKQRLVTSVGIPELFYHNDKPEASSGVLTCEDLEQFILSEVNESTSIQEQSVPEDWNVSGAKVEPQKAVVDDRASQHLLFLLQKGTNVDIGASENLFVSEARSVIGKGDYATGGNTEKTPNNENSLTLETLFGSAFMKELQSAEAPLSVQRGSAGGSIRADISDPHGLPLRVSEYESKMIGHGGSSLASSRTLEAKSEKIQGHWLGFDDSRAEDSMLRTVDSLLPEEESLITIGDPAYHENSKFMLVGNAVKPEEFMPSNPPVDIVDKLAALNAILKDERSMVSGLEAPPIFRGSYDPVDSSSQFPHHHINHTRPFFQGLDQNVQRNPQMKYMGVENIHHDLHHQFPPNVAHHAFHGPGGPRFDPAHNAFLQHMPVPGNFPPPHLLQGLPRGVPLPHPINHMAGYMPEMNPLQGFPLNHHQPNYGSFGMAMPGSGPGNGNHPEALERLIEMELRANSKQILPVAGGHNPGIYGPELDMGFRYR